MTWKDVGNAIADVAPLAGSLIGGPAGAAVGNIVASALGTKSEPQAVLDAIKQDPNAVLKLKEMEMNNKAELQKLALQAEANRLAAETQQMQTVNQTMQTEAKSEHWPQWGWRPYWGFVAGTAFLVVSIFVCYLGYQGIVLKDQNAMRMIPDLVTSMAELFAIPGAILGVTAWHRGRLKRVQAGEGKGNGDK